MANTSPWAQIQDQPPPPGVLAPISMPDAAIPQAFAPSSPPQVNRAPSQQEQVVNQDMARLEKVRWAQEHPWGTPENHPGKLGKTAHIFSQLGNIAGDIFAPSVMEKIPGTQAHMQAEENGLTHRLNTEFGQESQNAYRGAETGKTQEETAEMPGKTASEEGLQGAQAGNLESETENRDEEAAMGPTLAAGYAHAVNAALKEGRDPAQDPLVQHLTAAITALQPKKESAPIVKPIERGNKPHQVMFDNEGNEIKDLGESGEKPPVTRIETPGEERGAKNDLLKAWTPTLESGERMNVMTDAYEKAVKNHDQQAMLNLLANHLGMTMGLQKGARMTRDIINEAKNSTPWLQGMEARFDKDGYLTGVTLTPQQMRQMVNLGQERYAEDVKKSRSTAQYLGAKDDGPERVPGKATINYYLGLASGDPGKGKQLAAADGWTVK